jgi:hypothetical protein
MDMLHIAGNLFWFLWHFFSIPDTFRTFFEPWQRMKEKYHKGFDVEQMASSFVANTLMRIVGMFMRTILLFFALVSYVVFLVVVIVSFLVWIIIPPALVVFAVAGVGSLFK